MIIPCEPMKKVGVTNLECLSPEEYPEVCTHCPREICIFDEKPHDGRRKKLLENIRTVYHLKHECGLSTTEISHKLNLPLKRIQYYWGERKLIGYD